MLRMVLRHALQDAPAPVAADLTVNNAYKFSLLSLLCCAQMGQSSLIRADRESEQRVTVRAGRGSAISRTVWRKPTLTSGTVSNGNC